MRIKLLITIAAALALCGVAHAQGGCTRMLNGVNYQGGTTYPFQPSDITQVVAFTSNVPVTATLNAGTSISAFGPCAELSVVNTGAATVTINCSGCTINGNGSLPLTPNSGADLYGDGANFVAVLGGGGAVSWISNPSLDALLVQVTGSGAIQQWTTTDIFSGINGVQETDLNSSSYQVQVPFTVGNTVGTACGSSPVCLSQYITAVHGVPTAGQSYMIPVAGGYEVSINGAAEFLWNPNTSAGGVSSVGLNVNGGTSPCGLFSLSGTNPITGSGVINLVTAGTLGDIVTFNPSGCPQDSGTQLSSLAPAAGGRCYAAAQAGADICAQINACYLGSGTTATRAGIIDAIQGYTVGATYACNSNPFAGANKSGVLDVGAYNIATSKTWVTPQRKMRIRGPGGASPLGTAGNTNSGENFILLPCTSSGTPTGCTASIQQSSNLLFQDTNAGPFALTAVANTSGQYAISPANQACASNGCASEPFTVAGFTNSSNNFTNVAATASTSSSLTFSRTTIVETHAATATGLAACPTVTGLCRQHGLFSALGSGLTGPGNYYALIAFGGQNYPITGQDGLGTCGSGPVGADWAMSAFGGVIENVSLDMHGINGLIGIYSGNEQERSLISNVSTMNYAGAAAGIAGAGIFYDRANRNNFDACYVADAGNGGPSHFIIEHYFADPSPAVPAAGNGVGIMLEANDNAGNGGATGLAQFSITDGTLRGLGGSAKSNYGMWIDGYVNGSAFNWHCENMTQDCIYLQNAANWLISNVDESGVVNAVVELGTGTDNNVLMNIATSGAVPGILDDVNGCPGAFGASAPCSLLPSTGFTQINLYVQGGLRVPNCIQFANATPGANAAPVLCGGTGAPSGGTCGTTAYPIGSLWLRSDGATGTVSSMYSCKMVSSAGTWVGN